MVVDRYDLNVVYSSALFPSFWIPNNSITSDSDVDQHEHEHSKQNTKFTVFPQRTTKWSQILGMRVNIVFIYLESNHIFAFNFNFIHSSLSFFIIEIRKKVCDCFLLKYDFFSSPQIWLISTTKLIQFSFFSLAFVVLFSSQWIRNKNINKNNMWN